MEPDFVQHLVQKSLAPVCVSGIKAVQIIIRKKLNFLKKKSWNELNMFLIFKRDFYFLFYSNVANSASLIFSPKLE